MNAGSSKPTPLQSPVLEGSPLGLGVSQRFILVTGGRSSKFNEHRRLLSLLPGSKLNRRGKAQALVHVSTYQGKPCWNSGSLSHSHMPYHSAFHFWSNTERKEEKKERGKNNSKHVDVTKPFWGIFPSNLAQSYTKPSLRLRFPGICLRGAPRSIPAPLVARLASESLAQNPVKWLTQNHASRIEKAEFRGNLWLGSSLTNLHLPGF